MGIINVITLRCFVIIVLILLCIYGKARVLDRLWFFYVLSPRSKRKPVQNGLSTGQLKVITYDSYYDITKAPAFDTVNVYAVPSGDSIVIPLPPSAAPSGATTYNALTCVVSVFILCTCLPIATAPL